MNAQNQAQAYKEKKSILENKAIAGLKTVGNDKTGFRTWHDKFVNAMAQTIIGSREVFKFIVEKANEGSTYEINEDSWNARNFHSTIG